MTCVGTRALDRLDQKKACPRNLKTLGEPRENYNCNVAYETDQQKIKVPHAIERSTTSCEICDKCFAEIPILISEIESQFLILKEKDLWHESDSLMVDRGFTVENVLKPLGVSLNIPAFLHGREQLTNEEVTESQTMASARIQEHIHNGISLVLHDTINQI